jgi:O-antigen/teichoic acid export membrane protein
VAENEREIAAEPKSYGEELVRRHRVASRFVLATIAFSILLILIAVFAGERLRNPFRPADPTLLLALQIIIPLVFGLGAIAYRRTKFMALRLRDIASLQGTSALIYTLQRTTVMVALIGAAIAVSGFLSTVLTGNGEGAIRAGVIAIAILIYCYPRRAGWKRVVEQMSKPEGEMVQSAKGNVA